MDVNWYQNGTEKPNGFLKGFGRMFYIVDPKDTFFENEKDVPNFYVQSWPYFLMFMILEHIVLKLEGKKGLRLNESITSVSNGIFLEGGRLIWRGAESYMYTWIYTNWRLVELSWNSPYTWILAAIGVDFCYYWMHRACHEVHILWAQHQVHHTSEDFNMGVGIRQSMLQGWCGFLVYLPLALAIPPAQFVMHHQFSYLYMFWIHTESIKTLGPLECILNTPSHHRIHHGSNPYCIDVNYGGVLIIWDKLFGTFRGEKEGDRIVYGLIFQQPSFNPLHLQTFYTKYVVNSFKSYDKWSHKLRAVFDRPSWKPVPYVRFKDMPEDDNRIVKWSAFQFKIDDRIASIYRHLRTFFIGNYLLPYGLAMRMTECLCWHLGSQPAIHTRPKYDVILPRWCTGYLLIHYTAVLYGFYQVFLRHLELPPSTLFILVLYILASLTVFGMILDASPKAPYYETLRCLTFLTLANWFSPILAINVMIRFMYLLSGLFWFIFVCNSKEIQSY